MYVHAYQSLVWNVVAGRRWALHGPRAVAGDLVLVHEHLDKAGTSTSTASGDAADVDDQGEVIVRPAATDRANAAADYERARALTPAEAASGAYSVFDVVLPLPGFDVVYPSNEAGAEYVAFMASARGGGLDPHDMRRGWKDVSLSGGYRKLLGRPGHGMSYEGRSYAGDLEQLVETDLERLERAAAVGKNGNGNGKAALEEGGAGVTGGGEQKAADEQERKIAVILRMRLAPSMYATMALRELMKSGGVKTYKPDYGGGRG